MQVCVHFLLAREVISELSGRHLLSETSADGKFDQKRGHSQMFWPVSFLSKIKDFVIFISNSPYYTWGIAKQSLLHRKQNNACSRKIG